MKKPPFGASKVFWKCPHCGYTSSTLMQLWQERNVTASCDGCEKVVVVVATVTAQAFKIEGYHYQ